MDKIDLRSGRKYPDLDVILSMQENAKRLLSMTVKNASLPEAPHSQLVKDELTNMMKSNKQPAAEEDTSEVKELIYTLQQKLANATVANRCLSSFVLADFRGRLPQAFMNSYGLKRIPLTDQTNVQGQMFEFPHLKDVLYQPQDMFETRELYSIEWNKSTNGGIKLPRLSFIGDDLKGVITSGNVLNDKKIQTYSNKVQVPESGIKTVVVRATDQWVREISILAPDESRIAHISTGCDEGSIMTATLQREDEIVGLFGSMDSNMYLKSFGILVYTALEESD